ncbi:hypothetical protein CONPUDRAFT_138551 [Coniophora puteana RWD-64-598 SS2]|uniref:Ubiquitin 3 binding protein But2 C-terminal domain-containing protein n=1 Tax=Coniophora puteana (strain RWD-64-598) TaxID=741705 RepID=A0A5M3MFT0_CONPW|nr:uncharacterized protein CONPUDRAFT_138551 [Coniophora puteana RWD-64-598 SS2]EIW78119.1 hypothetical protein CONPUDRAFT_138551 [Coniophora puteana RWD-64-598 SS2]
MTTLTAMFVLGLISALADGAALRVRYDPTSPSRSLADILFSDVVYIPASGFSFADASFHLAPAGLDASSSLFPRDLNFTAGTGTPTRRSADLNTAPTPAPTGQSSPSTTVHIGSEGDFALLLPGTSYTLISDAEADGVSFCTPGSNGTCGQSLPDGFITGAAVSTAPDGSYIQVTGCFDVSKFAFAQGDAGGQFDVRFPNGAQCSFGGYGASFIEQVEPSSGRFCLRCCAHENDQENCNSHQDRAGCPNAVPGTYTFPNADCS